MSYLYILKSKQRSKSYVGSTTDLQRRPREHNAGLSKYSKIYKPWVLVYSKKYENIKDARLREKYFKSATGRRFIKKNRLIPR